MQKTRLDPVRAAFASPLPWFFRIDGDMMHDSQIGSTMAFPGTILIQNGLGWAKNKT